jgi:hypothetical protein
VSWPDAAVRIVAIVCACGFALGMLEALFGIGITAYFVSRAVASESKRKGKQDADSKA